jgi:hypothetical protein
MRIKILSTIIALLFSVSAHAADLYWADNTGGAANWAACESDTDPGAGNRCTITQANDSISAGETIYLVAGTYTTTISPTNNGTSGNYITYERDPDSAQWSVIFETSSSHSVSLSSDDYIKIKGIYFSSSGSRWLNAIDSDYIWFDHCKFHDANAYVGFLAYSDGGDGSDYGKITNCIFEDAPVLTDTSGCVDELGNTTWDAECASQAAAGDDLNSDCNCFSAPSDMIRITNGTGWLVEGNISGSSDHHFITVQGTGGHHVIRGNVIENKYHGAISTLYNTLEPCLIEDNIIKNGGEEKAKSATKRNRTEVNATGLYPASDGGIWRFNVVYNTGYGVSPLMVSANGLAENNYIYHNTFHNNDVNQVFSENGQGIPADPGNKFINNIFSKDDNIPSYNLEDWDCFGAPGIFAQVVDCGDSVVSSHLYKSNAWYPDNLFYYKDTYTVAKSLATLVSSYPTEWVDNKIADPHFTAAATYDFTLTSSSTDLIDQGAWLTTITSSSSSGTEFDVADGMHFFDGWGIPGETGDTIYTSTGQSAIITDVTGNTITVDQSISWSYGDGITVVNYTGEKPDIGAYEFTEADPEPPESITIGGVTVGYDPSHGRSGIYSKHGVNIR